MESDSGPNDSQLDVSNICVAVRCRPPLWVEDADVKFSGNSDLVVEYPEHKNQYLFDHVFHPDATQADVFQSIGEPCLQKAFQGYDWTIFAYGQTGTGKTYTMLNHEAEPEERGICPRVSDRIFECIAELRKMHEARKFLVQCSVLQIYNELIYDLLLVQEQDSKTRGLEIREQKGIGIYVKDLTEVVVDDSQKLGKLINEGLENRKMAATRRNQASSRSHCIITIKIHIRDVEDSTANSSFKICLVDLAGSERDVSGLQGVRSKEGANINKSLAALGNVIGALSSNAGSSRRKRFVHYRDSKLTQILQESLGGNSYCTMIATVTAALGDVEETMSTLNYARRAKAIKQTIKRYDEVDHAMQLKQEIAKLEAKIVSEAQTQLKEESQEHVLGIEEKYRSQINALESVMWQSWEDKERLSEQHKQERRRAAEQAQQAAEAWSRRVEKLHQQGQLQATIDAVVSTDPSFCADWSEQLRSSGALGQQMLSQLQVMSLYRESAGVKFTALQQLRRHHGRLSIRREDIAAACTLLSQVHDKLMQLIREIETLATLAMRFQELMCTVAVEVAVACRRAHDSSRTDLVELVSLVQHQLAVKYSDELLRLHSEVSHMNFESNLAELAKCLIETDDDDTSQASSSSEEVEHQFDHHDDCPQTEKRVSQNGTRRLSAACLHSMINLSTYGSEAMIPHKSGCQLPQPLGLSTGAVPDDRIEASSNPSGARFARLLQVSAYGGWSPSCATADEYLEVDLDALVGKAVVGVSLQGRTPFSGHWSQTHVLLQIALSPEDNAKMNASAANFSRPPVRLVHDVVRVLLYGDQQSVCPTIPADGPPSARAPNRGQGALKSGEKVNDGQFAPPSRRPFTEMSRAEKAAFFDNLIIHTQSEFGEESLKLTSQDILTGKNCQETNRMLQYLAHLSLRTRKIEFMGGPLSSQPQWTTAWKLRYFEEGRGWTWYGGLRAEDATCFEGNVDASSVKLVILPEPLYACKLRIHPVEWHLHPALRLEIHTAERLERGTSTLPQVSAEALKGAAQLAAEASMQYQQDLRIREESEVVINNDQRQSQLEQRLADALQRIQALEQQLAEVEASLLAAKVENEKLRATRDEIHGTAEASFSRTLAPMLRDGPLDCDGSRGTASSAHAGPTVTTLELEEIIEDLHEQLVVVTAERDRAYEQEEDMFNSLAEIDDELKRAQENYMSLVRRLQQRSLELFNTLQIMDGDWALSDLNASEELLYEGYFVEFAGSQKLVPVDNARLRDFILRHTGIEKRDLNTELLKVASLNDCFQLDMNAFLQILRETPVPESDLLHRFLERCGQSEEYIKVQSCRSGLLEVLAQRSWTACLDTERFEHIMDKIMADASYRVSLEQWFVYCRMGARIVRLLHFAHSRALLLG